MSQDQCSNDGMSNDNNSNDNNSGIFVNNEQDAEVEEEEIGIPWWALYRDIDTNYLLTGDNPSGETRLSAVLLNIKKNDKHSKQLSVYSQRMSKGYSGTNGPGLNATGYDRLFLFGIVGPKHGGCFVVLSSTSKKSMQLLKKFSSDSSYIGQTCVVLEPHFDGKALGRDNALPIVMTEEPFEPHSFIERFPVHFNLDLAFGTTNYFMIYGAHIALDKPNMSRANCSGVSCDRLFLTGKETSCCCMFVKTQTDLTITCRVFVRDAVGAVGFPPIEYRSKSLTDLLIGDLTNHSDINEFSNEHKRAMRNSIKASVQYINDNGGWNICGWARRGAVIDAADVREGNTRGEEVASEQINPHIISLKPTNTNEAFVRGVQNRRYVIPRIFIM